MRPVTFINEYNGCFNDDNINKYINSKIINPKKVNENQSEKKIPRPPNSYILYRIANYDKITSNLKKQGQRFTEANVSRGTALMWKNEKEEVRREYERTAELAKVIHERKYPHYKYQPKQKKANRVTKTVVQNCKSSSKIKPKKNTEPNSSQEINHQLDINEIFKNSYYNDIPPAQGLSQEDLNIFLDGCNFELMNLGLFENSNNENCLLGVCLDDPLLKTLL